MKVSELIECLLELDQDARVGVLAWEGDDRVPVEVEEVEFDRSDHRLRVHLKTTITPCLP